MIIQARDPLQGSRTLVFTATYNESGNVEELCRKILSTDPSYEMLVVDDNSPDGTGAILDRRLG